MEYLRYRLPTKSYTFSFYLVLVLPLSLLIIGLIFHYGLWSREMWGVFSGLRKAYPLLTQGMDFVSDHADDVLYLTYIGIIAYTVFKGNKRDRHFCFRLIMGLIFILVIVEVTKFVVGMPRPHILLPRSPFTTDNDFQSFPSGHTAQFVALGLPLVFYYRRHWLSALIAFMIACVGFSRLWLGHHYPIDVAGGLLVGSIIILLIFRRQISRQPNSDQIFK